MPNCNGLGDEILTSSLRRANEGFFGKRGKSGHVSCVTEKEEESYSVQCFVHLFEECKQDWFTIASIIENLLETLKREQPFISEVFLRSDNGACYHNASLLLALPAIGARTGIRIRRYDFSELQAGKDICNRKIALMKAHIRRYVNEKHDVTTAVNMRRSTSVPWRYQRVQSSCRSHKLGK